MGDGSLCLECKHSFLLEDNWNLLCRIKGESVEHWGTCGRGIKDTKENIRRKERIVKRIKKKS